jgi:thiol-disulfide isomerase/thioredoxin
MPPCSCGNGSTGVLHEIASVAGLLGGMSMKPTWCVLIAALVIIPGFLSAQMQPAADVADGGTTAPATSASSNAASINIDWQPPPWTLPAPSGENFRYPDDLQGPTIIFFWATWCPYCKALMPHIQSILDEYRGAEPSGGKQPEVLAVVFRDDGDPARVLRQHGYEFTLFTEGDAVAEAWNVKGTPGLFLADSQGRIVFSRAAIAQAEYPPMREHQFKQLSNTQKAARVAPYWASRLRRALDELSADSR